ncbi:conjugal transfer protein [Pseudomonas sp. FSL R10-0399]|uniref:TrbM/KikA/MpfK family conjugal transfer protein n=1 Tax=Pseudomonas sp. FSL R10-0399 TaxID=2662194 RepID=UPI001297C34B|nr:TrbM/KikA/MpfK family conjugal transfer protein [Pseudomonas sp. FSL R10-0399]MQT57765.1 conjugal transfer protein [Pseudomonas sp. FSL R10-0399]
MRKVISATLITIALAAQAAPAFAKDPCETVLCMAGMLQGQGTVDGCDGPVNDFFSIVKKKHGKFKPDATQDARRQFVNQCESDNGWGDKIADKYGKFRM